MRYLLLPRPALLLLDEPSLGHSPSLVKDDFQRFHAINEDQKTTILIVEQKVNEVLGVADYVYGIKLGQVVHSSPANELIDQKKMLQEIFL